MHFTTFTLPLLATAFTVAVGHVVLEDPVPYLKSEDGPSNPIDPSGINFPCKVPPGGSLVPAGPPTQMVIGEEQSLSFQGDAVHGGGSCQLALTSDFPPTKQTVWKVIHSIEGGCPARNEAGNLDGRPNEDKYKFTIPDGIAPGDYVFAWTWVQRIGGAPEFYMQCAPITVLAPKMTRSMERRAGMFSKRTDFPDLFRANIGEAGKGCMTSEAHAQRVAIAYPNPGTSVDHPEGTDNLFKQVCDSGSSGSSVAAAPKPESSVQTQPVPQDEASPAPEAPQAPVQSVPQEETFPIPQAPVPSEDTTPSTAADASDATPDTEPSAPTDEAPSTIPGMSPGNGCTEGHLKCNDDSVTFSICTGGMWTPAQPIAPGYHCEGEGDDFDIVN